MKLIVCKLLLSAVLAAVLGGCGKPAEVPATTVATAPAPATSAASASVAVAQADAPAGIAWKNATNDADVDAAFAQARSESKPVFVYWGAQWTNTGLLSLRACANAASTSASLVAFFQAMPAGASA